MMRSCTIHNLILSLTKFFTPPVQAGFEKSDVYLGVADSYLKFNGEYGWGFALMKMLVDLMLVW